MKKRPRLLPSLAAMGVGSTPSSPEGLPLTAGLGLDFGVDFLPEADVDFLTFAGAAGVEVPPPLALFLIIRTCSVIALGVQSNSKLGLANSSMMTAHFSNIFSRAG